MFTSISTTVQEILHPLQYQMGLSHCPVYIRASFAKCGAAPTSTVLIVGRAVAGLGSAGIFTGALVTVAHTVPLEKRPIFLASLEGCMGLLLLLAH